MSVFVTEFPTNTFPVRSEFVAQVIAWLRGTNYSTLLDDPRDSELDSDYAHIRSATGEELRLRELVGGDGLEAIGFRHDFPDQEGRTWRTEFVVRRGIAPSAPNILRLRTQCIAREIGAQLDAPRKPYLLKRLLAAGWGGTDGKLVVSDVPVWLPENEDGLALAQRITEGAASMFLPVIYVSAVGQGNWLMSNDEIEKLAYDTGGEAHVVIEPSREFSFRLRDLSASRNAYGGTLGVAAARRGFVKRLYLGSQLQNAGSLRLAAREACHNFRNQGPFAGWDWTDLQESSLRRQRLSERSRISPSEVEALYQEEIENLGERILQLEDQLKSRPMAAKVDIDEGFLTEDVISRIGQEVYDGEFSDRLLYAVGTCLQGGDMDLRTKAVLESITKQLPLSKGRENLLEDIKSASKDSNRVANRLVTLLCRHGYFEKSDNKHIRLEASPGYFGLESITLPKTPSDYRGLINLRKQLERTLGIK